MLGGCGGYCACPLEEAAPRTQPVEGACSHGPRDRDSGRAAEEPWGFGWEDPALAGRAEARLRQSRAPEGRGGPGPTVRQAQAGTCSQAVRIVLAGWVESPVHRGAARAPEE